MFESDPNISLNDFNLLSQCLLDLNDPNWNEKQECCVRHMEVQPITKAYPVSFTQEATSTAEDDEIDYIDQLLNQEIGLSNNYSHASDGPNSEDEFNLDSISQPMINLQNYATTSSINLKPLDSEVQPSVNSICGPSAVQTALVPTTSASINFSAPPSTFVESLVEPNECYGSETSTLTEYEDSSSVNIAEHSENSGDSDSTLMDEDTCIASSSDSDSTNTVTSSKEEKTPKLSGKINAKERVKGKKKGKYSSRKCKVLECMKRAQTGNLCIAHGGGRPCSFPGCTRRAQTKNVCKPHGGGVRCNVEGCEKYCQSKGVCRAHGGGKRCSRTDCTKWAQKKGRCLKHFGIDKAANEL